MNMTEDERRAAAIAFLKRAGLLRTRRTIDDPDEMAQILTMLRLLGPGEVTNNQHVWTESWRVGNRKYNIHSGTGWEELEEVIDEDQ